MDIGDPQRIWESEPLHDPVEVPEAPMEREHEGDPAPSP